MKPEHHLLHKNQHKHHQTWLTVLWTIVRHLKEDLLTFHSRVLNIPIHRSKVTVLIIRLVPRSGVATLPLGLHTRRLKECLTTLRDTTVRPHRPHSVLMGTHGSDELAMKDDGITPTFV